MLRCLREVDGLLVAESEFPFGSLSYECGGLSGYFGEVVLDVADVAVTHSVIVPFPVFACVDLDLDCGAVHGCPVEGAFDIQAWVLVLVHLG